GPQARRPGEEQPRHRQGPLHLREHRQEPHPQHPGEAAPPLADGGGRLRGSREAPRDHLSGPAPFGIASSADPSGRIGARTPPPEDRSLVIEKLGQLGEGRRRKRLEQLVGIVNSFEPEVEELSDEELRNKTAEFRRRLADGETLDDLLPEAFACVREAARRPIGQRHFDVQVMGAIVLHEGNIAEMKTGEGKTLDSTMPAYLNALEGKSVHVVTVNDYLAKRDSEWMGPSYRALGVSVGLIQASMSPAERKPAYAADITYGTNNEFGFDYLRDNMAMRLDEMVQRGHHYAIVDEVDSILIDEARTPLIISGMVADSAKWYQTFARLAPRLRRDEDYEVDEAKKTIAITESGVAKVEDALGLENLYEHVHTP